MLKLAVVCVAVVGALAAFGYLRMSQSHECRETAKAPTGVFALAIQHIGPEDRPVPLLVLYASDHRDRVRWLYDCDRAVDCSDVPVSEFTAVVRKLWTAYFAHPRDDAELSQAGSFAFTLDGKTSTTLRCNLTRSAAVLEIILHGLGHGVAKDKVMRRLQVTRI